MITKMFEVRDRATFIPVMATKMLGTNNENGYLVGRCGFGVEFPLVTVTRFHPCESQYDPYKWCDGSRTMFEAHQYIQKNFDALNDGDVVDVEYILGETSEPKKSERIEWGL